MFPSIHGVVSQGGAGDPPLPSGIVTYVGGGDATPVISNSIFLPLSPAIQSGDLILVTVWARSAINTPAGYTLAHTGPLGVFGGRIAVFTRTAVGNEGGTGLTITWTSSGRAGAAHLVARGTAGTPEIVAIDSAGPDTSRPFAIPTLANTGAGRLGVTAYGNEYAATGGVNTVLIPPSGYTLASVASRAENRHGLAYRALSENESVSGSWNTDAAAGPWDTTTVSAILKSGA